MHLEIGHHIDGEIGQVGNRCRLVAQRSHCAIQLCEGDLRALLGVAEEADDLRGLEDAADGHDAHFLELLVQEGLVLVATRQSVPDEGHRG